MRDGVVPQKTLLSFPDVPKSQTLIPLKSHKREGILLANSNQLYFNNLVKTPWHKTSYRCPHRLNLTSQCSRSCAHLNSKPLNDKDLEFANSIPPIFATSLCKIAGCNYNYINQLCGKSRKLVSRIKVSLFSSWRVNETERGTVLGLS